MPTKGMETFTNKDSRLWVQPNGVGTAFLLYTCHAIPSWSRDFGETTYVKCKSPDEYGKYDTKESIAGSPGNPTFSVEAYTSQEADFLLGLDCPVDFQEYYGKCSAPADPTGYVKIRHFYRCNKTSEEETNVDFIGEVDAYSALQLSVGFTAEEVVEILQVDTSDSDTGVTEGQPFNDIAILREGRCEGDCGPEIKDCYWGIAVGDADYGSATANVWYTDDGGATWNLCAVDPFTDVGAHISSCVILIGETNPRFIVFRGSVSGLYGARCSISDDWGATWDEVDMGGTINSHYVNSAFAYSSGLIYAVGNGGYIWYSEDKGASWTEITNVTTGTAVELWDIHTCDADTIYAVGDDNTVIKSTDGGTSWADVDGPADATENLYTVQSPTKWRVIVGGEIDASEECLWISDDGGTTWSNVAFTGSTLADGVVRRVRLSDVAQRQHMVLIHGANNGATKRYGAGTNFRFHRTLDGGATWERQDLVTNSGLNGLSVCTINRAFACGQPSLATTAEIQKMATT